MTNGTYIGFSGMIANVSIGVIIIPLISVLESIAIASAFSGGKTIDATQVSFLTNVKVNKTHFVRWKIYMIYQTLNLTFT